ncbi:MAG: YbaK/EbsC family protein [Lachnospiraceae bacterium]|nr:YbaK/EbsC family protein [Lachnospiraceae bacterium]
MSFEKAKYYLDERGYGDRIIVPEMSSSTVESAAAALGCEPGMIAKTLSFLQEDRPVLILAEGTARIDNKKYRHRFGCKAKMIPPYMVEELIGHSVGGVCPFGINEGVTVYLDESLKLHETVYPAAGSDHSAVRLSIADLEDCSGYTEWVDVCKLPGAEA